MSVQVSVKKRSIPKQRFLSKRCKVFSGQGGYDRAFEFGLRMKAFLSVKPSELQFAKVNTKAIPVQTASGTITLSSNGELPVGMANDIIDFVSDMSALRKVARIIPMSAVIQAAAVRVNYSAARFFRDVNYPGAGQIIPGVTANPDGSPSTPAPTKLFIPVTLVAKEIGDVVVTEKTFGDDMVAAMGASLADDMGRALAIRENYAAFLGTGAADGTDGGITGLLNKLPAGSQFSGPAGSNATWAVTADNYLAWLDAIQQLPSEVEWVIGGREPVWMCSHKFYNKVLGPLNRRTGGTSRLRPGEPVMFDDYEVVFNDLMPRSPGNGNIPLLFGQFDHAIVLGDRQTVEIVPSGQADINDGTTDYHLWAANQVAYRAIERIDVQFLDRGLGSESKCGVVAGLKAPTGQ